MFLFLTLGIEVGYAKEITPYVVDPCGPDGCGGTTPVNDSFSNATVIYTILGGTKTATDTLDRGYGSEYYFKFEALVSGYVNINMTYIPSVPDSYSYVNIFLYNSNLNLVQTSSLHYGSSTFHFSELHVTKGQVFYIEVDSRTNRNNDSIKIDISSDDESTIYHPTPLEIGKSIQSKIDYVGDEDYYTFTGKNNYFKIYSTTTIRLQAWLYDSKGDSIAYSNDLKSSKILKGLKNGETYKLKVKAYDSSDTGSYSFYVSDNIAKEIITQPGSYWSSDIIYYNIVTYNVIINGQSESITNCYYYIYIDNTDFAKEIAEKFRNTGSYNDWLTVSITAGGILYSAIPIPGCSQLLGILGLVYYFNDKSIDKIADEIETAANNGGVYIRVVENYAGGIRTIPVFEIQTWDNQTIYYTNQTLYVGEYH